MDVKERIQEIIWDLERLLEQDREHAKNYCLAINSLTRVLIGRKEEEQEPYCKICQAKGVETHTHDTTDHECEPILWGLVAHLITWTYRKRAEGDIGRDRVLGQLWKQFGELTEEDDG